jgi:hypothetical protein
MEKVRVPRWLIAYTAVWLVFVVAIAGSGQLASWGPPRPQLLIAGLTILLIVLSNTVPSMRAWLRTVDPRTVIGLHLIRLVGFYFLWLSSRGELAREFALTAGVGDIAVAVLAGGLWLWRGNGRWYRAALVWNVLGLIDILFAVGTATRIALSNPSSIAALLHLPLSLVPTLAVPMIIASHVWLFGRLRAARIADTQSRPVNHTTLLTH